MHQFDLYMHNQSGVYSTENKNSFVKDKNVSPHASKGHSILLMLDSKTQLQDDQEIQWLQTRSSDLNDLQQTGLASSTNTASTIQQIDHMLEVGCVNILSTGSLRTHQQSITLISGRFTIRPLLRRLEYVVLLWRIATRWQPLIPWNSWESRLRTPPSLSLIAALLSPLTMTNHLNTCNNVRLLPGLPILRQRHSWPSCNWQDNTNPATKNIQIQKKLMSVLQSDESKANVCREYQKLCQTVFKQWTNKLMMYCTKTTKTDLQLFCSLAHTPDHKDILWDVVLEKQQELWRQFLERQ